MFVQLFKLGVKAFTEKDKDLSHYKLINEWVDKWSDSNLFVLDFRMSLYLIGAMIYPDDFDIKSLKYIQIDIYDLHYFAHSKKENWIPYFINIKEILYFYWFFEKLKANMPKRLQTRLHQVSYVYYFNYIFINKYNLIKKNTF